MGKRCKNGMCMIHHVLSASPIFKGMWFRIYDTSYINMFIIATYTIIGIVLINV